MFACGIQAFWASESVIQLKVSGCPLKIGIQNLSSIDMESVIQ